MQALSNAAHHNRLHGSSSRGMALLLLAGALRQAAKYLSLHTGGMEGSETARFS